MKLHEYQAKQILQRHGVNVPEGIVAGNVAEATSAYTKLGATKVAVKSQIHAGGRGKGLLYDGPDPKRSKLLLQGGVKIAESKEVAVSYASSILGGYLHTLQTGEVGKRVTRVYLEKGTDIQAEFYLSILLDRSHKMPLIVVAREGGMDIEQVAAETPDRILKLPVNLGLGLQAWQIRRILFFLGVPSKSLKQGSRFLRSLWEVYTKEDAILLEINPLVLNSESELVALDCKMEIDDNALFRHPETAEMLDVEEEDPFEMKAAKYNLNYVRLNGNVGCMVNGAGLAMATMDIVKLAGAEPANFLDVGGGANAQTVANGFEIILQDPNVKAIFVNIFGGIVQCDRVASGIVEAAKKINISVPLVVRLQGTNALQAREILADSGIKLSVAEGLDEGAQKIVQVIA